MSAVYQLARIAAAIPADVVMLAALLALTAWERV